jgi:hypothetical protein
MVISPQWWTEDTEGCDGDNGPLMRRGFLGLSKGSPEPDEKIGGGIRRVMVAKY